MFKTLVAKFERDPPFWHHKIWSNFIFSLWLVTLKILCVWLKRLKSPNFGGPRLGGTPNFLLRSIYF